MLVAQLVECIVPIWREYVKAGCTAVPATGADTAMSIILEGWVLLAAKVSQL